MASRIASAKCAAWNAPEMEQRKHKHGCDGRMEIGVSTVETPPGYDGDYEDVARNIRECPADHMLARNQISKAQHRADCRFRQLYEASQGPKSVGVVDPSSEPVHCSRGAGDGFSDRRLDAIKKLGYIRSILGRHDFLIVTHIGGQRLGVHEAAQIWSEADMPSQRVREYIGMRYRDALTLLAKSFGYAS